MSHGRSTNNARNFNPCYVQTEIWYKPYYIGWILLCIIACSLPAAAQPSGGPYGPIRQTYDLPAEAGKIYYVAPDGKAKESGETLAKPTTLEAAIERAVTGDVIIMRGGVYRTGELQLNQGITIQPYSDEEPILKGTMVANQWECLRNGLWKTSWTRLFPSKPADWWWRQYHGKETPLHRFNNDMVFVDGKFLQSAGWEGEVDENSYFIDYENGLILLSIDPTERLVEITAFNGALRRVTGKCHGKASDREGLIIRGITFTQYAYCALEIEGIDPEGLSDESRHGKEVIGTILENCTLTFCSRVAAYLRGDHLTLRNCRVSDTSTEGIYILSSCDVLLEKNIFTRNNIEKITGYYPAAVKIFNQCYRVICRDNLVIDLPYSNGIWYDVGNVDGYFLNNWIEAVGNMNREFLDDRFWPSDNGFFFEISKGAVCAGNVFVNCDQGIYVINSSDVKIYNNTLINSTVSIVRTARSAEGDHFGWHPSTGPDVDKRDGHVLVNNLFTGDKNYHRPLLAFWQQASLCERLKKPQVKQLDHNVYLQSEGNISKRLILWSPAQNPDCQVKFASLEDLRKMYPQFCANSRYFSNYNGPLFKSSELGNYQLLAVFPGSKTAIRIPVEVSKLLGLSEDNSAYIGAYPPMP
jgi:parallel beta-helix repeat protein